MRQTVIAFLLAAALAGQAAADVDGTDPEALLALMQPEGSVEGSSVTPSGSSTAASRSAGLMAPVSTMASSTVLRRARAASG